jgi:hypothetical protein
MKKIIRVSLLTLALLPVVVAPGVLSPFLFGKTLFMRVVLFVVAICATALLFTGTNNKNDIFDKIKKVSRNKIVVTLFFFIISVGLSTLFAYDRYISFFSDVVRQEGFLTIVSFYFFFLSLLLFFKKKDWEYFFLITIFSGALLFLIEIIQVIKGMQRPDSLIGNPIFLGMYYLFVIYSCTIIYVKNNNSMFSNLSRIWKRNLAIIISVISLIGILLTKSRGVLVGMAIGAFATLVYALAAGGGTTVTRWNIRVKKIAMWLIVLGVVAGGTVFVTRTNTIWTHIPGINRLVATTSVDATTRSRIVNAQVAFSSLSPQKEGWRRMIFGWGQDNFVFMWNRYYNPEIFTYDRAILDRAHNKLIDVLVMQGFVGILTYLVLWIFIIKSVFTEITSKKIKFFTVFYLISYFVSNLFVFDTQVTYLAFFFVIAFIASQQNYYGEQ